MAFSNVGQQCSAVEKSNRLWEGDRMLHIYLYDYLRKRGYSQTVQAFMLEAGIPLDQEVPIDAPQSLLFEWWSVFWEVFTARSIQAANRSSQSDSHVYVDSQESKQKQALYEQQLQQHRLVNQGPGTTPASWSASASVGKFPRQFPLTETFLNQSRSPLQPQPHPPNTSVSPAKKAELAPSPNFTTGGRGGLKQIVDSTVVDQRNDVISPIGREASTLPEEENDTMSRRVRRLQIAQNEAKMRMAQLHGYQARPALLNSAVPQSDGQQPKLSLVQPTLKRKGSPNVQTRPARTPAVLSRSMSEQQHPNSITPWPPTFGPFAGQQQDSGPSAPSHIASTHNTSQEQQHRQHRQQQQQQQQYHHHHQQQQEQPSVPYQLTHAQHQSANLMPSGVVGGQHVFGLDSNTNMGPPASPVSGGSNMVHAIWSSQTASAAPAQHLAFDQGAYIHTQNPEQPSIQYADRGSVQLQSLQPHQELPFDLWPPSRPTSLPSSQAVHGHPGTENVYNTFSHGYPHIGADSSAPTAPV